MSKKTITKFKDEKTASKQILVAGQEIRDSLQPLFDILNEISNVNKDHPLVEKFNYQDDNESDEVLTKYELFQDALNEYKYYIDHIGDYIKQMPQATNDLINTANLLVEYLQSISKMSLNGILGMDQSYINQVKQIAPDLLQHILTAVEYMHELKGDLTAKQSGGSPNDYSVYINGSSMINPNDRTIRHFNGEPKQVAIQVISQLNKDYKIFGRNLNGINQAVLITLKNSNSGDINYFGWIEKLEQPIQVMKKNIQGQLIPTYVNQKNIVVPAMKYKNASQALANYVKSKP